MSSKSKRYTAEFKRDASLRGARPAVAERQCAEDELAGRMREIHAASRGAYGVPRVHAELRRKGHGINPKRVERITRERDIRGITRRAAT